MTDTKFDRRDFLVGGVAAGVAVGALAAASEGTSFIGTAHGAMGKGRLTLHAIDTFYGQTKAGLKIDLSRMEGGEYKLLKSVETVERGRTKDPLIPEGELVAGRYELLMHLEEYFNANNAGMPTPPFLADVHIRFGVYNADQKFHVPILFSPWSYSYYRGS